MNIKQLRVLRGLKQKELADKMGISAQQLNNYEGGQSNPGNKILPALADALGVSTAYLRGDAQRLAVYDWQTGRTEALPIVSETVIDEYGFLPRRSPGCRDHCCDPIRGRAVYAGGLAGRATDDRR